MSFFNLNQFWLGAVVLIRTMYHSLDDSLSEAAFVGDDAEDSVIPPVNIRGI